ncbi:hypothetical protein CDD83_4668 [Cordyceps sp. RAO-2017]|nr:hypothetical protein CDD83_4668 [Cordyceps sp. RAO-2017]
MWSSKLCNPLLSPSTATGESERDMEKQPDEDRQPQSMASSSTMSSSSSSEQQPAPKLRIFASPLVRRPGVDAGKASSHDGLDGFDDRVVPPEDGMPEFKRYQEPTLLEIFFDLFFAANYNVFSETQKVTNHARFKAYVGYFCLLWLTWFLVTLFDVRYVTDSIFSRLMRAVQLGVLVGFVVVAPHFDPTHQKATTMRAMSLILCVSRATLAIEYGSTLLHLRRYKKARRPIYLQIGLHVVAAAVYLGIAFRFREEERSRIYMTWYFFSGGEAILSLLLSNLSPVLSLTHTHLMKRIALLTVMILGDGVVQVAKEVVIIVKKPSAWDSATIGLITAAAATIYFMFLIYFDWMRARFHLPALRQQLWVGLHLALHLALVLHLHVFSQWILWYKIWSRFDGIADFADPSDEPGIGNSTSQQVADRLEGSIRDFFGDFKPSQPDTMQIIDSALANISSMPDAFWPVVKQAQDSPGSEYYDVFDRAGFVDVWEDYYTAFLAIVATLDSSLFSAYEIDLDQDDIKKKEVRSPDDEQSGLWQVAIPEKGFDRCRLAFAYGYVSAGVTIFLLATLLIILRTLPRKVWPLIRLAIIYALALGTGLVALLWFNETLLEAFLTGPWVLPTLTLVWGTMLVLTHINGEGVKRNKHRFTAINHTVGRLAHRRNEAFR